MAEGQDIMSTFKKLLRINKEGGSMSSEERTFFEQTKKKSVKLEVQARSATSRKKE